MRECVRVLNAVDGRNICMHVCVHVCVCTCVCLRVQVKKTAAKGETLKEAMQINKSLSALGHVIKVRD